MVISLFGCDACVVDACHLALLYMQRVIEESGEPFEHIGTRDCHCG